MGLTPTDGLSNGELDPALLMQEARDSAGLNDFGDPGFEDPMRRWLRSMSTEASLTEVGRLMTRVDVVRLLVNRLRMERDLREHPEALTEIVDDPIIVTGLARTGTTKLQRTIASIPEIQSLAFWRLMNPAPFPDEQQTGPGPRIDVVRQQVAMMREMAPEMLRLHPVGAEQPDEEIFMMEMSFDCLASALRAGPNFMEWWRARPPRPSYEYLRRLLQYCQWQSGGRQGPWVLKTPAHLGNLSTILDVFPKATIVHCHRDPRVAIASTIRMSEVSIALAAAAPDPVEVGRFTLDFWAQVMRDNLDQRRDDRVSGHIVDAHFADICAWPATTIERILQSAGLVLDWRGLDAIAEWERMHQSEESGLRSYALERYGLSAAEVEEAFADYIDAFPQTVEAASA